MNNTISEESSAQHTPGPWAATTRRGSWDWVVYQVANPNVEICQPFHDGTDLNEIGEANARLIAAAPELAKELRNALDEWESHNGRTSDPDHPHWSNRARAALAKAEGR